ncbi:molybdopterin molybdotransferase MoeA [Halopseudomonas bauzanensis]|uniref:Molybdopterin molybdenumtransferase n=1 Tax=Halopseudomonas bauzanensis TaxID=653930 RepID=A0A1I4PCP9_9GAMM|nr:gephyrin-like molybdotransferase Glp [Halopseudomonas bauzanensis]SES25064.1 molybdopterin molybdotransferase [Halopseudomonas bauzanensis]SFM25511.1 molybdopterin molybdotransferase [Halopseudomonas bauzanensis]
MACGTTQGLLSVADALATYRRVLAPLSEQELPIEAALGQVLAETVRAAVDLPLFDQSAVDGYAVRSEDLQCASPQRPVTLTLSGEIPAGQSTARAVAPGCAMRILTGAPVPAGADTIVRQEWVVREGGVVRVERALAPVTDLRLRGEELRCGAVLADPGLRLDAGRLAALAMAGVSQVKVHPRARVTVLVTGDEVKPVGELLAPGQIFDANGPLVRGWLAQRGQPLVRCCVVADRFENMCEALAQALEESDAIITTGGVSVGDRDHVPDAAERLGLTRHFWKLAQKPGKPLWFGTGAQAGRSIPLIGLPGNPAAVLVGLAVHVAAVIRALEGEDAEPEWGYAALQEDAMPADQRDQWLRMQLRTDPLSGTATLAPLPRQASHMLSNMMAADVLAWVPASEEAWRAGSVVRWLALR